MSLARALVAELDDAALDQLADLLADRLGDRLGTADTNSPWLTVDETAARMRCSRQRVYDLRHSGALIPSRDGRRLLFARDDVDAYLRGVA